MIAVDTNILVYAHRRDSPFHIPARDHVRSLASRSAPWGIPWPCVHEFVSVVTSPRVFRPPSSGAQAVDQVDAWLESPALALLGEASSHWSTLRELVLQGKIAGGTVHDARIAALCADHGVTELWSADRDFSRFPQLKTRNPLIG